ncbi:T9SS type A sorting domain-containing protein [Flavobacterium sp.]|uniref:T9SS type A sorting domain-containing protein n=1 Tax=Flavobacterium sp. TaxID=239 RepID=UPI0040477AFC
MKSKLLLVLSVLSTLCSWAQIPTSGLIKDYKFTNGVLTSDVNPTLQLGNTTLIPTGFLRTVISDRNNEADKAISLNGDSFYAGGTSSSAVNKYAISFWVKTTTNESPKRYILDQYQSTNNVGFTVSLKDGKVYFNARYNYNVDGVYTSGNMIEIFSNTINDGQWHHVVCQVLDTTVATSISGTATNYAINYTYSMYVDKILINTLNDGTNIGLFNSQSYGRRAIHPTQPLLIGRSNDGANLNYVDSIDQIRYYETTFSYNDIEELFNEDKPITVLYVDVNASGLNDGTSWSNAYTDLQTAITNASGTDEIWVKSGTYKPNGTLRTSTFLIADKRKIYGGFNGTETTLSQRNPKINITTLSGDLNENDNSTIITTEATRQDNTYHVVSIRGNARNSIIDGFIISGGNANGPTLTSGTASAQYYHTRGGAIYINPYTSGDAPSVVVRNCVFQNNSGSDTGVASAYFANGLNNMSYRLDFDACVFKNNFSGTNAQVLYAGASGYNWIANGEIKNCLFNNNTSTSGASCLYLSASTANSGNQTGINIDVINATFASNTGVSGNVVRTDNGSNVRFKNSIIYNNGSNAPFNITGTLGGPSLQNTISQGGQISGLNVDPLLNANFTLQATSPAINTGDNAALPANTNFDLAGNARIVNTTVDKGAYEYDAALSIASPNGSSVFSVYPNPTNGLITIETDQEIKSVKLFSLDGKQLLEGQNSNLQIDNFPSGIYMLYLESVNGTTLYKKIIKN